MSTIINRQYRPYRLPPIPADIIGLLLYQVPKPSWYFRYISESDIWNQELYNYIMSHTKWNSRCIIYRWNYDAQSYHL